MTSPNRAVQSGAPASAARALSSRPFLPRGLGALALWLAAAVGASAAVTDLRPLHDPSRVLTNPCKGWYHHYPDNHIDKYRVKQDADLLEFPGMDHLYIRLAWGYLEPAEGRFNWAVIDSLIEKWTARGLGIAFRISCKETSTDRVEQQFATPRWVMEAGARGGYYRMGKAAGPDAPWEPVYDDPVFLEKLDRFLAAFAARFDGRPWVRYVDIGSVGDWGEGHAWAGSRQECSLAARLRHIDLHLKHFKRSPLVVSDDFVFALSNPGQRQSLHRYVLDHGISYRDDSILVNGYLSSPLAFTVRSPEFFAGAFPATPTVLELEHYGTVKRMGNWDARPDSLLARHGKGLKGPDYFRGALQLLHATYIGYHGDAREWLSDNPDLTRELLNKCGYWLFPVSVDLPAAAPAGSTVALALAVENRGVAPPYALFELRLKLASGAHRWIRPLAPSVKTWMPGPAVVSKFDVPLPSSLAPGDYTVSIGLFYQERPVEFALKREARDAEGYYAAAKLRVTPAP